MVTSAEPMMHYIRLGGIDVLRVFSFVILCCSRFTSKGILCMLLSRVFTLIFEVGCNVYDIYKKTKNNEKYFLGVISAFVLVLGLYICCKLSNYRNIMKKLEKEKIMVHNQTEAERMGHDAHNRSGARLSSEAAMGGGVVVGPGVGIGGAMAINSNQNY